MEKLHLERQLHHYCHMQWCQYHQNWGLSRYCQQWGQCCQHAQILTPSPIHQNNDQIDHQFPYL